MFPYQIDLSEIIEATKFELFDNEKTNQRFIDKILSEIARDSKTPPSSNPKCSKCWFGEVDLHFRYARFQSEEALLKSFQNHHLPEEFKDLEEDERGSLKEFESEYRVKEQAIFQNTAREFYVFSSTDVAQKGYQLLQKLLVNEILDC